MNLFLEIYVLPVVSRPKGFHFARFLFVDSVLASLSVSHP